MLDTIEIFKIKLKEVITMARQLANKKEEEAPVPEPVKEVPKEDVVQEQVQLVTMDQLILARLDNLTALTVEGFKQVGVDFNKPKD